MSNIYLTPQTIEAFHKGFEMFEQFARDQGVTIMGTAAMLKRLEGGKFGNVHVKTITFNHPANDQVL